MKRLRFVTGFIRFETDRVTAASSLSEEAADRIEELETQLAEALEIIKLCREMQSQVAHPTDPLLGLIAEFLKGLKGKTDDKK